MISPELLRRYPLFGALTDAQLKAVAMVAEEETAEKGQTLISECQPANSFFLLLDGGVDLYYTVKEEYHPEKSKEFSVGEVNPGELLGVSALVAPYEYSSTGKAAGAGRVVRFNAPALRALFEQDVDLAYKFMHIVAQVTLERLTTTRVQLAAAWS